MGAGLLLVVAATGCGDGDSQNTSAPSTSPTATTTKTTVSSDPPAEVTSPIDGSWKTKLTRADIKENLEEAGLGRWASRLFSAEDIDRSITWVYTYGDGRFSGAWLTRDGLWQVGWWGSTTVNGRSLAMFDEVYKITEEFTWAVSGDRLSLEFVSTDATVPVKGIPDEVYMHAYFTDPLTRTTCPSGVPECAGS